MAETETASTSITADRSTPIATRRAVVVVGRGSARSAVVEVLRERGREVRVAERAADLEEHGWPRPAGAIVLLGQQPGATLDRTRACLSEIAGAAPVVLVLDSIEGWEVRAALAAGVVGIVAAEQVSTALHPCLLAVAAGQVCIPRRNLLHAEPPVLSSREKQVLGLVVMGYMNGEIAARLYLAESTIKSHLSSAFAKLGVHSRHEAVDLILDPERGLGTGILALGADPVQHSADSGR